VLFLQNGLLKEIRKTVTFCPIPVIFHVKSIYGCKVENEARCGRIYSQEHTDRMRLKHRIETVLGLKALCLECGNTF